MELGGCDGHDVVVKGQVVLGLSFKFSPRMLGGR